MVRLAKEKFTEDTPIKKCDVCGENRKVYLETRVKTNHAEDSIFCSKVCVKKGFGGISKPKKIN